MKVRDKIFFGIGIAILMILHWFLFPSKEGFFDDNRDYDVLRNRLRKDLGPYCKLANFVREQASEMQKGMGGTSSDISQMYSDVYTCKDSLASSRPSCSNPNTSGMRFVPCSIYMDLPDWTSPIQVTGVLARITDDLPERLTRELEWFSVVMKKIQEGLAAGANPAAGTNPIGVAPTMDQLNSFKEGFLSCSPEASEYLRQQLIAKEASSCTPSSDIRSAASRTPVTEIARINRLLDSPSIQGSITTCTTMSSAMLKIQSDLEKLKNGTLYDWQKADPPKAYAKFEGGDRTKAFLFSMQQNQ